MQPLCVCVCVSVSDIASAYMPFQSFGVFVRAYHGSFSFRARSRDALRLSWLRCTRPRPRTDNGLKTQLTKLIFPRLPLTLI